MSVTEICMIVATAASPLVAVQVSKWLEGRKEDRERRLYVFRTLMATRAQRVSTSHVHALNQIDLNFDGSLPEDAPVITAWKEYLDNLSAPPPFTETLLAKREDLFVALLGSMGEALGYKFERLHIRKNVYLPNAHGELDEDQRLIRKSVIDVLQGKAALHVQNRDPGLSELKT